MNQDNSQNNKTIKIVCISDTHNQHSKIDIPLGDILIHSGDFSNVGSKEEVSEYIKFLSEQPHKHKIIISGNHDLSLDIENFERINKNYEKFYKEEQNLEDWKQQKEKLKSVCTYLENDFVELYGYKFYGSPYSVIIPNWDFIKDEWEYMKNNWAFMQENLKSIWDQIPSDTDVLITHGPPHGIQDVENDAPKVHEGCKELRKQILERIKPLYHIYGHCHDGYGIEKVENTNFVNAAMVDANHNPTKTPLIFELPIREN